MAEVEPNPGETDKNLQIEDGIRRSLDENPVASVDRTEIESNYVLLDSNGVVIEGTVDQKCQQINTKLQTTCTPTADRIIFVRSRRGRTN